MKTLLTLLPLTFVLCGCSAFVPVAMEKATIKESEKQSLVREPMRVVSAPYLGEYAVAVKYQGSFSYALSTPTSSSGWNWVVAQAYETTYSLTDGYATASFTFNREGTSGGVVDVFFTLNVSDLEEERLHASYDYLQENQTYNLGANWDVNEFNYEYRPEISLYCEWTTGSDFTTYTTLDFPLMYGVDVETFGTIEPNQTIWVKSGNAFNKTYNAIYVDNTEPKLYGFWLDTYMLARQIRLNGDIINQNYVTGMDRLDPSFGKQVSIRFNPSDDASLKVSAVPYDPTWDLTNDYNLGYNNGYADGKADGETPVSWMRNIFDGMASFFSVEIIPHLSLGLIMFAPLLVLAIIVIVRIFKHGG